MGNYFRSTTQYLKSFSDFILKNRAEVSERLFCDELANISKGYYKNKSVFYKEIDSLGDTFIKNGDYELAGIVYSRLCKFACDDKKALEFFARKGYDVAEKSGDIIHMNSKLSYLRDIIMSDRSRNIELIQIMQRMEEILKTITENYDSTVKSFHSLATKPSSLDKYKLMLARIQTDLAKYTKRTEPEAAKSRLNSAKQIFIEYNQDRSIAYIDLLEHDIAVSQGFNKLV